MATNRTGIATGWKIFWGTVAALGGLVLAGMAYLAWALSNSNFG